MQLYCIKYSIVLFVSCSYLMMEGSRPAGVQFIIPHGSVCKPTQVTSQLIRVEKPLQMEGDALAIRILDLGQPGTKFNR